MFKVNGREVEVTEIEGAHSEGAYAIEASFVDTDEALSDEELDTLNDHYSEELYDDWYQRQVMRAESLFEGDR